MSELSPFGFASFLGVIGWSFAIAVVAFPNLNRGRLSKYGSSNKFGEQTTQNISWIVFAFFEFAFGILLFAGALLSGLFSNVQSNYKLYIALFGSAALSDVWMNTHNYVFEGADATGNGVVIPLMQDVGLNVVNAARVVYDTIEPEVSLLGYTARDFPKQTYYILIQCETDNNLDEFINTTRVFLTALFSSLYNFITSQGGSTAQQQYYTDNILPYNDIDLYNVTLTLGAVLENGVKPWKCFCNQLGFIANWLNNGLFTNTDAFSAIHYGVNAIIELLRVPFNALVSLFMFDTAYTCTPYNDLSCQQNRPPKFTKFFNYTIMTLNYTAAVANEIANEIIVTLFGDLFNLPPSRDMIAGIGGGAISLLNLTLDTIFHIDLVFSDDYISVINYNPPYDNLKKGADGIDFFFEAFGLDIFTNLGCTISNLLRFLSELLRFASLTWQVLIVDGIEPVVTFVENYDFTDLILAPKAAGQLCFLHFGQDINPPLADYFYFQYKYISDLEYAFVRWVVSFAEWLLNNTQLVFDYQPVNFDLNGQYISLGNIVRQFDPDCVSPTTGMLPDPFNQTDAIPTEASFFCCVGNYLQVMNQRMESLIFMFIETVVALVQVDFTIIITGPAPTFDMQNKVMVFIDEENEYVSCGIAALVAEANGGQCFSQEFDSASEPVYQAVLQSLLNVTVFPYRFITVFNTAFKIMLEEGPSTDLVCYEIISNYDMTFGVIVDVSYTTLRLFGCLFPIGTLDFATTIWGIFGWDYSSGFNLRTFLCQVITDIINFIQFLVSLISGGIFNTIAAYFQATFDQIADEIENAYLQAVTYAQNIVNDISSFLQNIFVTDLNCFVGELGTFFISLKTCLDDVGQLFISLGDCIGEVICFCAGGGGACGSDSGCPSCNAIPGDFSACTSLSFDNSCDFKRSVRSLNVSEAFKNDMMMLLPHIMRNITTSTYPAACLEIIKEARDMSSRNYSRYGLQSLLTDKAHACTESFQTSLYVNVFLAPSIIMLLNSTKYGPKAGYISIDPMFLSTLHSLVRQAKQLMKFAILYTNFQWRTLLAGGWNQTLAPFRISHEWTHYIDAQCPSNANMSGVLCPLDLAYVRLGVMGNMIGGRFFKVAQILFNMLSPALFDKLYNEGKLLLNGTFQHAMKRGIIFPRTTNKINVSIEDHSMAQRIYHTFYGAPRPKVRRQIDAMWDRFYLWWNITKTNITSALSKRMEPSEQAIQTRMGVAMVMGHIRNRFDWNVGVHNHTISQPFKIWHANRYEDYFNETDWRTYVGDPEPDAMEKRSSITTPGYNLPVIQGLFCYNNYNICLNCEFVQRIMDNFMDNMFIAVRDSMAATSTAQDFVWIPYESGLHFAMTHWMNRFNKTDQEIQYEKVWSVCETKYPLLFSKISSIQREKLANKLAAENGTIQQKMDDLCYRALNIKMGIASPIVFNGQTADKRPNDYPVNGILLKPFMDIVFPHVNTLALKIAIHNFFNNFNITDLEDLSDPKVIEHYINFIYNTDNAFPGLRSCTDGFGLFTSLWFSLFIIAVAIGLYNFVPASIPFTFWTGDMTQMFVIFGIMWMTLAYGHNFLYLLPIPLPVLPKCLCDDFYAGFRDIIPQCVPWTGLPGIVNATCSENIFVPHEFPNFGQDPYNFDSGLRNLFFILHWKAPTVWSWIAAQSWIFTLLSPLKSLITTDPNFPFPAGETPPDNWWSANIVTTPNYIMALLSTCIGVFLFLLGLFLIFLVLQFVVVFIVGSLLLSVDFLVLVNV